MFDRCPINGGPPNVLIMSSVSYRHFTGTAAENYQRDFVPAIAEPVSRDLLHAANLQRGERVLDVACGTGLISRLASECVGADGSVTGIDIAPDMIEVAKSVAAPDGAKIDWRGRHRQRPGHGRGRESRLRAGRRQDRLADRRCGDAANSR